MPASPVPERSQRCGVEVAPLRREPADGAEQVTQALRGELLQVTEQSEGWARVVTAYGYPGWIRAEELCGDSPLEVARTFLGTPYEWGGLSARGLDCSGLVHLAYRLCGQLVPRDAWQQDEAGAEVAEPEPGDLVTYGDPVDHVVFWAGEGRILHATGREGVRAVVEEPEPEALRLRRRRFVRLLLSPV
ncbi:MAG TPA: C40 family peptidase [Gaiellaceae bacterium]|nr:C40 family peptidase [Gaiellaceae bacterium]